MYINWVYGTHNKKKKIKNYICNNEWVICIDFDNNNDDKNTISNIKIKNRIR